MTWPNVMRSRAADACILPTANICSFREYLIQLRGFHFSNQKKPCCALPYLKNIDWIVRSLNLFETVLNYRKRLKFLEILKTTKGNQATIH